MKLLVFFVICAVSAYDLKFDYQIEEGKARFVETIDTNLGKNTVTIYTPAHNDVLESYKKQDFQKGLQIVCLPSIRQCRLRAIDTENNAGPGQITESFLHSWNKGQNSISSSDAKVIEELYYIDGKEVTDTVQLGEELRMFYEQFEFPLYQEHKIPDDAEILNITRTTGGRVKRAFIGLNNDCNGQDPKRVFGVDTGRSCNYLKICKDAVQRNGQTVFADCNNVHITSPLAYVCVCCPWVQDINPNGDDCSCTKLGYD